MNLHTLKNTPGARPSRKRVGRGPSSGMGKTSGRGHKGQYARSGHKHKPGFEGGQMRLVRRLPKRGFHHTGAVRYAVVNVEELERFENGTVVTAVELRAAGLVGASRSAVKVLGSGDLTRKLTVKVHAFSAGARAKIVAAGGTCETEAG
jgi:large subunit ribosomal protein L15